MKPTNVLAAATLAFSALAATPVAANTFTLTGDTTMGPTFNRPVANGDAAPTTLSTVGTAVSYNSLLFAADTSQNYDFLLTSLTTGFDTYLGLYQGVFNPASPLTNVLVYNDDFGSTSVSGFTRALTAGQVYTVVITGFENDDFGAYRLNIGPTAAVPEGSSWALLLVGVGLVGGVMRHRARVTRVTFA